MAKRKSDPSLAGQLDMFGDLLMPISAAPHAKSRPKASTPDKGSKPANTDVATQSEAADVPLPANDMAEPAVPRHPNRPGRPSHRKRDLIHHGRALGDLDARALLRAPELAELLGLTLSTLAKLRCSGKGPPFYKLTNQTVGYKQDEVMDWLSQRRRVSTWTD